MNNRCYSLNPNIAWEKYLRFETFAREKDCDLSKFLTEWEEKMVDAQSVGCNYSDLVLALKLIEKVNLDLDSTQFIIAKMGSVGSQHFLPKIMAEIKNKNFVRAKDDPPWPSGEHKLDPQLGLKKSFADDITSLADFADYNDLDAEPKQTDVNQIEPEDSSIEDKSVLDEEKSSETFGCSQCSQVFRSKFKWEQHLRLHANRFQCSKCEKGFLTKNVLKVHMRRCQPGVTLDLDNDIEDLSSVKNESELATEDKLDAKSGKTVSPCEICGQLLKESNMKNHLGTHTRKYKCNICNKRFSTKYVLKKHVEGHSSRRDFICTFCGKTYKTKFVLNTHMNTHTKAKSYICAWCGKKFFNQFSWKVHVRSQHTGEGAHHCNVCQKKFFTASKLRYHMRTHTGEKPYKCEFCGKNFGDCSTYKKHKRRIHSKGNDLPVKSVDNVSFDYE